jgi:hypothetical protein
MKPLFTIHAGELLVEHEIQRRFALTNVWIPTKDTGVDLLVSNRANTKTVSLQVKFSRDYLVSPIKKNAAFLSELRAGGWWTPTRQQIKKKPGAKYWVFVLVGFANRSTDFIIIKPDELLKRLDRIHRGKPNKFQSYLWVTKQGRCFETRGLSRSAQKLIAEGNFEDADRDFTEYLDYWEPIKKLNH